MTEEFSSADLKIIVPERVRASAEQSYGAFFQKISKASSKICAEDHLDLKKSIKRAELLERYTPLRNKKLLEIGSGFGTNLAMWIERHQIDGYGLEPDGPGFGASFAASRELFSANGIDPERITSAKGEILPFEDASFDIVYSANVLEHTDNPAKVLEEAIRVLRPGGILHFEMPNFLSYFEGHYNVIQPPILWSSVLAQWVRLLGRDPSYAMTFLYRDQSSVVPAYRAGTQQEIPGRAGLSRRRNFPRPSREAFSVRNGTHIECASTRDQGLAAPEFRQLDRTSHRRRAGILSDLSHA